MHYKPRSMSYPAQTEFNIISKASTSSSSDHDHSDKVETKHLDFSLVREWLEDTLNENKPEEQVLDLCIDYLKQEERVDFVAFQNKLTKVTLRHDIAEELWRYLRKMMKKAPQGASKKLDTGDFAHNAHTVQPSDRCPPSELHHDVKKVSNVEPQRDFDQRDSNHASDVGRRRQSDLQGRRHSPELDPHVGRGHESGYGRSVENGRHLEQPSSLDGRRGSNHLHNLEHAGLEHPRGPEYTPDPKNRDTDCRNRSDYRNSERRHDFERQRDVERRQYSERYQDTDHRNEYNRPNYSKGGTRTDEAGSRDGLHSEDGELSKLKNRRALDGKTAQDVRPLPENATSVDKSRRGEEGDEEDLRLKDVGERFTTKDGGEGKEPVPGRGSKLRKLERSHSDRDSLELSEDERYYSRRRKRRSRSRSADQERSRERRRRRRRRRHEDDEDDDDREHRRRRRRHRRRSTSRSRSPYRTLSEERERERRRDERRARRRERELMKEEERGRRRAKKRKLDPDEPRDRDLFARGEKADLHRGEHSRPEYYDEHDYRRHRLKHRRHHDDPRDNDSLSGEDLGDGRYYDGRRHHRHRREHDYRDGDDRRLKGAFHRRHDEYIGGHDNEDQMNGDVRRQLPAKRGREYDRRFEDNGNRLHNGDRIYDGERNPRTSQSDYRNLENSMRKIGSVDLEESRQTYLPHKIDQARGRERGQLSTRHAEFELEAASQRGIPSEKNQVTKRAHVTSRLGRIEPKNVKMPNMATDPSREGIAKPLSGSTPWDARSAKNSFGQEPASGKEGVKSKVTSMVLDRLRSKVLASMSKKSLATNEEETVWNPKRE